MTIDKQALREAAEKADSGDWSYGEFNSPDLTGGAHIRIDGRGAVYCLNKATGGIKQSRVVLAYIAAFNPKVALALLDENLQLQREKDAIEAVALALRDDMRQAREQLEAARKRIAEQREYYEGVIADGSKRIAELERSETQLINERDDAESALNDAYKAVMGQAPEWSNWFSFGNAIDEIELACELWRNQTDDVIQFRQRIAELEARAVNLPKRSVGEVMHLSGFSRDYAEGWCAGNDNAIHEIRAAGIKVKGE
ncbi:ead/Ea22-like family protein [Salmonella enterica subsp. enterica serovar Rubislaw]|nr:ead/Ea22-like family protein [Salmonella enterica subsp. enterica serovar Rubislaw]